MEDSDETDAYDDAVQRIDNRVEIIETDPAVVTALWIAIGISGLILLVCAGVYAVLKLNILKRGLNPLRRNGGENHQLRNRNLSPPPSLPAFNSAPFTTESSCGAYIHSAFVQDEDIKLKCAELLKEMWYIPRNFMDPPDHSIDSSFVKLRGKYGNVYESSLKSSNLPVSLFSAPGSVIKTCNGSFDEDPDSLSTFYKDLDTIVRLDKHQNVLQVIGYMEDADVLLFAVEACQQTLKSYLLNLRSSLTKQSLNPYNLLLCAMNIAEGMFHLQSYQITHGQLSSHNVVLSELATPKITGFGLLQADPPHEKYDHLRWESAERMQNRCIQPSDAWSFGVLLWEMATLGGTPYHDIRTEDLAKRILTGSRPVQTGAIGDPLYQVMLYCWQIDRDERPDFSTLSCSIHELLPHCKESLFQSATLVNPPYIHEYEHSRS